MFLQLRFAMLIGCVLGHWHVVLPINGGLRVDVHGAVFTSVILSIIIATVFVLIMFTSPLLDVEAAREDTTTVEMIALETKVLREFLLGK